MMLPSSKRILRRLSQRFQETGDKSYANAMSIVTKANPAALQPRRKACTVGVWDRWTNGNQYGSYSSDED